MTETHTGRRNSARKTLRTVERTPDGLFEALDDLRLEVQFLEQRAKEGDQPGPQKLLDRRRAALEAIVKRFPWDLLDGVAADRDDAVLEGAFIHMDALMRALHARVRAMDGDASEVLDELVEQDPTVEQNLRAFVEHQLLAFIRKDRTSALDVLRKALVDEDVKETLLGTTDYGGGPRRAAELAMELVAKISATTVRKASKIIVPKLRRAKSKTK
jgi:hypothetical protein